MEEEPYLQMKSRIYLCKKLFAPLEIMINLSSGLFEMAGQQIEEEDLEAASKDIMATIDEDGDGDVTKVQKFYFF